MRMSIFVLLLFSRFVCLAQTNEEKLSLTIKDFHAALVAKNTVSVNQQTDKALSYGHSNGWVENKSELISHLETGYMVYRSFTEDSLKVTINGNMAHARFVADIAGTLNGNNGAYHLKVLEVWVRKGNRWLLFARQAVRG
jgi:ketosteroid isomerase-like protein